MKLPESVLTKKQSKTFTKKIEYLYLSDAGLNVKDLLACSSVEKQNTMGISLSSAVTTSFKVTLHLKMRMKSDGTFIDGFFDCYRIYHTDVQVRYW